MPGSVLSAYWEEARKASVWTKEPVLGSRGKWGPLRKDRNTPAVLYPSSTNITDFKPHTSTRAFQMFVIRQILLSVYQIKDMIGWNENKTGTTFNVWNSLKANKNPLFSCFLGNYRVKPFLFAVVKFWNFIGRRVVVLFPTVIMYPSGSVHSKE